MLETVLVGVVMVGTMMMLVRGLFRIRPSGRFTSHGITSSGRAVRFVLWSGPFRAMQRGLAHHMALLTVEGRQWAALLGFGIWTWILVWVSWTIHTFESLTAFLGLLWIWWFIRLIQRAVRRKHSEARRLEYEQLILKGQQALAGQIKQIVAMAGGGTTTMLTSARHLGREHDQMAEKAAEAVRAQSPDDPDEDWMRSHGLDPNMPTGQEVTGWGGLPRWVRRRRKDDDE
jgi:hypothetical protein